MNTPTGLTSDEASRRLTQFGPNAVPDTTQNPFRRAMEKFWAPVPWMLEAAIVLQMMLGEYAGAAIIACLLAFNVVLGFVQEGRAQATLAALKSRLALTATVRRNGVWTTLPAADLVPGDIVKLSLGAVVAADVRLVEGSVQLDQSMLTGESMPIEAGPDFQTYAGALVRRGEAVAEVTATAARTKFGRTAELVLHAHFGNLYDTLADGRRGGHACRGGRFRIDRRCGQSAGFRAARVRMISEPNGFAILHPLVFILNRRTMLVLEEPQRIDGSSPVKLSDVSDD